MSSPALVTSILNGHRDRIPGLLWFTDPSRDILYLEFTPDDKNYLTMGIPRLDIANTADEDLPEMFAIAVRTVMRQALEDDHV